MICFWYAHLHLSSVDCMIIIMVVHRGLVVVVFQGRASVCQGGADVCDRARASIQVGCDVSRVPQHPVHCGCA